METTRLDQYLTTLREHLPELAKKFKVLSLSVFGSYAHDEEHAGSDLDLLVTFRETPSLLTFLALENYLTDLLGIQVDLVMKDALKPRIGARVLSELVPV